MLRPSHLIQEMPHHLGERVEVAADRPLRAGRFVLYWMHHAMRAEENPALEVALAAARFLDAPILVYQGFSGRHPYSNDRHLRFALEGARDVESGLAGRGVPFAFHLPTHPAERSPLRILVREAACLITEDFPAQPFARWTTSLTRATRAPVLGVDTTCILPMRLVGRAYGETAAFLAATGAERRRRAALPWPVPEPAGPVRAPEHLPFRALDLESADLASLIAACEIDHEVPPAPHLRGGTREGMARWESYRRDRLAAAKSGEAREGRAPAPHPASRLSPYLHYGMISPFRIAREALAADSPAAEIFLEHLLGLREQAYTFCRFRPDHDTVMALPGPIREAWRRHGVDSRTPAPSWEALIRGRTGDQVWDRLQRELSVHGELADDRRRIWGAMLARRARTAGEALALLLDLDHRFALDSSDPCSYTGTLGCLRRIDPPESMARPTGSTLLPAGAGPAGLSPSPASMETGKIRRVAVIGAGIAGLAAARILADHGALVTVFEKNDAPGGRAGTHHAAPWAFDHGTLDFNVSDERFRRHVDSWCRDGVVRPAVARRVESNQGKCLAASQGIAFYRGDPEMSALARHLARGLEVRLHARVDHLERIAGRWILGLEETEPPPFDALVLALAAPQAHSLLVDSPSLARPLESVSMRPCWALMLAFDRSLGLGFDQATVIDSPLERIARQTGGPRGPAGGPGEAWVAQARASWSAEHPQAEEESVQSLLLDALREAIGTATPEPAYSAAHLWRHARASRPLGSPCLWDPSLSAGVCGDWCSGTGIEAAYLSGVALAGRLLGTIIER